MEVINPPFFPRPEGYAHMTRVKAPVGGILLLGGLTGVDETGAITAPDDLVGQLDRALLNLRAAVEFAGGQVEQIARLRVFTTQMERYRELEPEIGEVWRRRFGGHQPALTLVGVSALLAPGALVAIECEAYLA